MFSTKLFLFHRALIIFLKYSVRGKVFSDQKILFYTAYYVPTLEIHSEHGKEKPWMFHNNKQTNKNNEFCLVHSFLALLEHNLCWPM